MPVYKAPLSDIQFLLSHVFPIETFVQQLDLLEGFDVDTGNAILDEAAKISEQLLSPLSRIGDEQGCQWHEGAVSTPEGFKQAYTAFCDGGWGALGGHVDYGGLGMPKTLVSTVEEIIQGANMALGLAPMLTAGACLAIQAYASDDLKKRYLPNMYSGQWSGAMDLTEAHCGTDLGLIRTKAEPCDDGSFLVTGSKIFITWGEHDMAENIVHLVLARLPGAPPGVRGISLFLVPKLLSDDDGVLLEANNVNCGSIERKMGIHGSATCVMNFDSAKGWLIGEPHKGLACMFTMMNYERLVVGIQGLGVSDAAYQIARDYALGRRQGRAATGVKDPQAAADPIIAHADVRRMLLECKSLNEAARAFYIYVARFLDLVKYSTNQEIRSHAEERVALLTPVIKAFMTDRSFESCVKAQQVLGGHGYIREWGIEQCVRDARITQIYEGTNGIQAMDLIGRKTHACQAKAVLEYINEMRAFAQRLSPKFKAPEILSDFEHVLSELETLSKEIVASTDVDYLGSVATDYLDIVGYVSYAYMWLNILGVDASRVSDAEFVEAKWCTGQFFFKKLMPHVETLKKRIEVSSGYTMSLKNELF